MAMTPEQKKELAAAQRLATRRNNECKREMTPERMKAAIEAGKKYHELCGKFLAETQP